MTPVRSTPTALEAAAPVLLGACATPVAQVVAAPEAVYGYLIDLRIPPADARCTP